MVGVVKEFQRLGSKFSLLLLLGEFKDSFCASKCYLYPGRLGVMAMGLIPASVFHCPTVIRRTQEPRLPPRYSKQPTQTGLQGVTHTYFPSNSSHFTKPTMLSDHSRKGIPVSAQLEITEVAVELRGTIICVSNF